MYSFDAIEIVTNDGTGVPCTYTNTAFGLASDGHFYLITGHPGLTGSKTITGDTARTVWYENILADDVPIESSHGIDFVEAGARESISGLMFGFIDVASLIATMDAHTVYFGRRKVIHYKVTSSDLLTFAFEKRWEGVIDESPWDELVTTMQCVDNSKDVFGETPKASADKATYPLASVDALNKPIPIAFGRVAYSELLNVVEQGDAVILLNYGGVSSTVCAGATYPDITGYPYPLPLRTRGVKFVADDKRLIGASLTVVSGGIAQTREIISNNATVGSAAANEQVTYVFTSLPFDVSTPYVAWEDGTGPEVWYFEARLYRSTQLASSNAINEFKTNSIGTPAIFNWDDAAKAYLDISEIKELHSTDNIDGRGFPGITIKAPRIDNDGGVDAYFGIQPIGAKVYQLGAGVTTDAGTGDVPTFYDKDISTYKTFTFVPSGGTVNTNFYLDIDVPSDPMLKTFDDLSVVFDISHNQSVAGIAALHLFVDVYGIDIYGRATTGILPAATVEIYTAGVTGTLSSFDMIPEKYFNLPGISDFNFYAQKAKLSLSTLIDNFKKAIAYPKIRVLISVVGVGLSGNYLMRFKEIAFIGKKALAFSTNPVYSRLIGETFGSTWGARKTAIDPILLAGDAVEGLLRKYSFGLKPWQESTAYAVGSKIRSIADNGHVYIATVGGTSNGNLEPTFPTTAGATVTDNDVTWKEFGTLKINTASFDTVAGQRSNWPIGRTLAGTKKKDEDWLDEILAQTFTLLVQNAAGEFKLKAWRDNTTPLVTFDTSAGGNVVAGSLGKMTPTPARRVYNDLLVKYDWNPGLKAFNKQIFITNITEPSFPGISELTQPGTVLFTAAHFTIVWVLGDDGAYLFKVVTDTAHGLETGDYTYVTGNIYDHNYPPSQISVEDDFTFYVDGHYTTGIGLNSGTLYFADVSIIKWRTFAGGYNDYVMGKTDWDQCHNSYVVYGVVQKNPASLGECYWFPDPDAVDAAGNRLWPDLIGGDEHPAMYLMHFLAQWSSRKKNQIPFEAFDDSTNSVLEVGDPIALKDSKYTAGAAKQGWIHRKAAIAATATEPDRFRFEITLNPYDLHICDTITETGSASDTYTESGSQTTTITEGAC